jgi:hypothetical protein
MSRTEFCITGARVYSLVQDVLVIAEFGQWHLPDQIQGPCSTIGGWVNVHARRDLASLPVIVNLTGNDSLRSR